MTNQVGTVYEPQLTGQLTSAEPTFTDFSKDNLIMIPNGDQKRLLFYLNTLLLDFMATILKELETLVRHSSL